MQPFILYLTSAIVMLLLEYFVLLRLYQRSKQLRTISLIVAPIMIIVGLWITIFLQDRLQLGSKSRVNVLLLFVVIFLLELPLSIYGYEIKPDASILERCIVVATFGTVSVLIAQSVLTYF